MTEVRKPGRFENWSEHGQNIQEATKNLKNLKRGGGDGKIFPPSTVRSLNVFVLKLRGHYVPGLKSVQAYIVR